MINSLKTDPNKELSPTIEYRKLPAVDSLLRQPAVILLATEYGQALVTEAIRILLVEVREKIAMGNGAPVLEQWPVLLAERLMNETASTLRPVINATGVILHTNLGRSPLSKNALHSVAMLGSTYSTLEYDLTLGERGSRHDHPRQLICKLTGAEDAIVVNNCAAALYLTLTALCLNRSVIISRGQLVEIGGGFRIPDVLRQSGAHLVEVGTTNRTHLRDFQEAINEQSAAILRVHSSNFRQLGFVTMPTLEELTRLAHQSEPRLLVIDDLGSGTLLDTAQFGLQAEPTVQESLAAGVDIVTFSGDKLLGGPQAGIIAGRQELIAQIRRHPMARALRVDKMTLAALDATLRSYLHQKATQEIPIWQMISATLADLQGRALVWQKQLETHHIVSALWQGESAIGGGSLPGETLPTWLLAIVSQNANDIATKLRGMQIPIVCRIQKDHLIFDPRTVLLEQDEDFIRGVVACLQAI